MLFVFLLFLFLILAEPALAYVGPGLGAGVVATVLGILLGLLMLVVGVQLVMTGLLGELMMRVYFESSGRKTYAVRETC